jgi:hypothetical protein
MYLIHSNRKKKASRQGFNAGFVQKQKIKHLAAMLTYRQP